MERMNEMNILKKMKRTFGLEKQELDSTTPYGETVDKMQRYGNIIDMYSQQWCPHFDKKKEQIGKLYNIITYTATFSYRKQNFKLQIFPLSVSLYLIHNEKEIKIGYFEHKQSGGIQWFHEDIAIGRYGKEVWDNFPEIAYDTYKSYKQELMEMVKK